MIAIERFLLPGIKKEDVPRLVEMVACHLAGDAITARTIPSLTITLSAPDLPLSVVAWEIARAIRESGRSGAK
jgi:hypothetical protein